MSDRDLGSGGCRAAIGRCQTGIRLIDFRATTSGGGSSMIPMGWGRGLVNPLCHHSIGTRETTMKMKMTKRGWRQTRCDWGPPIQSRFQACDPASAVRVQCDGASPATSTENRALYASTACRGRPALTIHFEAGDPASLLMAGATPLQKPHGNIQTMHSVTRPRLQQSLRSG